MASLQLQASRLILSKGSVNAPPPAVSVPKPKLSNIRFPPANMKNTCKARLVDHDQDQDMKNVVTEYRGTFPKEKINNVVPTSTITKGASMSNPMVPVDQLYPILEAVADRIEMHTNVGEQRDNWNTLLLNSINMITLTAATMAGVAAATDGSTLALNLSSTLLFSAATGLLVIMNKIQPSQLAEEQRNATRLFKQLQRQLEALLAVKGVPSEGDVEAAMEKVLALDRAYPLPLLGKMIEKFPKAFEPADWWPSHDDGRINNKIRHDHHTKQNRNGWSEELEADMREILKVVKSKDTEDYMRLGNLGLKINKTLAVAGPLLTATAAAASLGGTNSSWAAVAAGSLAAAVNTLEHGGQVGMVVEMYRNCAGFFTLLEESIESTLNQTDVDKRENGEMFELKVALQLGRSVSELRHLAKFSQSQDDFASKLF